MTQNDRLEWLKLRQSGLGGSDIGAICGFNPYATPLDVYNSKVNEITEDTPKSDAAHFGTLLEDVVAKEFERRTGLKVQRVNKTLRRDSFMLANIDRAIINPKIGKTVRVNKNGYGLSTDTILECKTASSRGAFLWGESHEEDIKRGIEPSAYKVPTSYLLQVQWYMLVTGCELAYIAVLIDGSDFRYYRIRRSEEIISELVKEATNFWTNHVLAKNPPSPVNREDIFALYKKDNGELLEATPQVGAKLDELRSVKEQISELTKQKDALEDELIVGLENKEAGTRWQGYSQGGRPSLTYKASGNPTFNQTRFKTECPELYEKYKDPNITPRLYVYKR